MERVEVASKAEVVHQMRSRQRDGLDLGYLLVLAVAAVAFSVAAIAVAVHHMLLQPVAAVATVAAASLASVPMSLMLWRDAGPLHPLTRMPLLLRNDREPLHC